MTKDKEGFFGLSDFDQLNRIETGPSTDELITIVGMTRLRCGVRIYRITSEMFAIRKRMDRNLRTRLINNERRRREMLEAPRSYRKKTIEAAMVELKAFERDEPAGPEGSFPFGEENVKRFAERRLAESLERTVLRTTKYDKGASTLAKRQVAWSDYPLPRGKCPDYPLHLFILYLAHHLRQKRADNEALPYTMMAAFLDEQGIKTYALEKAEQDIRVTMPASNVIRYYERAVETRDQLQGFYETCRRVYLAPYTLYEERIHDVISIDHLCRVFADDPPQKRRVSRKNLEYCQLLPSWKSIFPPLTKS